MMSNLNVFRSIMQDTILSQVYVITIVTKYMNVTLMYTIVLQLVFNPKVLQTIIVIDIYSTSTIDNAIVPCFLLHHETKFPPMK